MIQVSGDPSERLADHLRPAHDQPELGPVLRRRRHRDVRPGGRQGHRPGRPRLLQAPTASTPTIWPTSAPGRSPPWERPPTATSEVIDGIFHQPPGRPGAAPHRSPPTHWLSPVGIPPGTRYLPDPAHCLLAIRECPDRALVQARRLRRLRPPGRFLSPAAPPGIGPDRRHPHRPPRTSPGSLQSPPSVEAPGSGRTRQLLTAMNFTLQTLPPAKTDRRTGSSGPNLNYAMAQLYIQNGALDLARERLDRRSTAGPASSPTSSSRNRPGSSSASSTSGSSRSRPGSTTW